MLLPPVRPPLSSLVDLRLGDCSDPETGIASVCADLVIADPPWTYHQQAGQADPGAHYGCLSTSTIVEHLTLARGARLALWLTWPLLGEWEAATRGWAWGPPVTGGAWGKSGGKAGHYGPGYHWAGCSEPVLVYCKPNAHNDRSQKLRNSWMEGPGAHSAKPIGWMVDWVRRWVPPGGLVADPYAGLGTVARATLSAGEGRRYVGWEIDAKRHAAASSLIAQWKPMPERW